MESSIKRRKIAAATLNINDLPVGFLINAASYLPKRRRGHIIICSGDVVTMSIVLIIWRWNLQQLPKLSYHPRSGRR